VQTTKRGRKRPNPLASLNIASEKEAGIILWYGSLLYSGYFAVLSTLLTQLQARYGFDSLKIGFRYLPLGIGSLTSHWTVSRIFDKNFHRLVVAGSHYFLRHVIPLFLSPRKRVRWGELAKHLRILTIVFYNIGFKSLTAYIIFHP